MVVALTFINGEVHLRSKFVASKHRTEEQQQEKFLYRGQMGTHPNSALKDTALYLKNLITFSKPRLQYRNPSNTNVFYWGGKVRLKMVVLYHSLPLRLKSILARAVIYITLCLSALVRV